MSKLIAWIGAGAERPEMGASAGFPQRRRQREDQGPARDLPAHEILRERVPVKETEPTQEMVEDFSFQQRQREEEDRAERRTYRGRTVAMLRRYMRYSIETGRLPSLQGREFFRAKVTAYRVVMFEQMVNSEAAEMAAAVIGEGKKGQLATVKYLFKVAEIYPPSTDGSQTTKDEECFSKSLMDRLRLSDKPIALDDGDDG